ncbi:MAG: hypothetical protein MUO21_06935 [Nitrososphaeraceae archaeon]|nr:hypothetical protein [Nitrososphaeraceae archaeon]
MGGIISYYWYGVDQTLNDNVSQPKDVSDQSGDSSDNSDSESGHSDNDNEQPNDELDSSDDDNDQPKDESGSSDDDNEQPTDENVQIVEYNNESDQNKDENVVPINLLCNNMIKSRPTRSKRNPSSYRKLKENLGNIKPLVIEPIEISSQPNLRVRRSIGQGFCMNVLQLKLRQKNNQ